MTKQEQLVIEIYRIKNEINTINGKATIDLDAFPGTFDFYKEVKHNKVYELEQRLDGLKRALETIKREMAIRQRREAFYATPEGQTLKTNTEAEIERLREAWEQAEQQIELTLQEQIQHRLGAHWGVNRLRDTYLEIGILDPTAERKFIFGQTADIYCSRDIWNEKHRFEINIGTCGSTNLLGGTAEGEHSRFYIGIGQLFAATDLCEWIKQTMVEYKAAVDNYHSQITVLQEKLQNPITE